MRPLATTTMAFSVDAIAAVAFSVDQNLGTIIGVLIGTVVVVLAVIKYIDDKIESKLKVLRDLLDLKQANMEAVRQLRHDEVLAQITNLKEIIAANLNTHTERKVP